MRNQSRCEKLNNGRCRWTKLGGCGFIPACDGTMNSTYEYGIDLVYPDGTRENHRSGMDIDEALDFVYEWNKDGGRLGAFIVVHRLIGPWETFK